MPQLRIEIFCKFRCRYSFVIGHALPLCLPSENEWLLKVIAIQNKFVVGLYRRQMKAISYLGKIEKLLGVPATNRNWNTILKVAKILESSASLRLA